MTVRPVSRLAALGAFGEPHWPLPSEAGLYGPAVAGLVFIVHPVHVEGVGRTCAEGSLFPPGGDWRNR